jgi:two-component system chemotaxis sensor kinase CheA
MRPTSPYEIVESVAASLVVTNLRDAAAVAELAKGFDTLASELEAQAEEQDRIDLATRAAARLRDAAAKADPSELASACLAATAAIETLQRALKPAAASHFGRSVAATPKDSSPAAPGVGAPAKPTAPPTPPAAGPRWDADTVSVIGDFLQESAEGLAQSDDILVAAESGTTDPESINTLFRAFHTIKGVAGFLGLEDVTKLAHTTETLLNAVREKRLALEGDVVDTVLVSVDAMRRLLALVKTSVEKQVEVDAWSGLGELVARLQQLEDGAAAASDDAAPVASPRSTTSAVTAEPAGPAAPDATPACPPRPEPVIVEEPAAAPAAAKPKGEVPDAAGLRETVKVDLARVDALVEMVGELVIVEAMVVHAPEIAGTASPRLRTTLGQLAKITRDLQDIGMRMRMVPMRATFQKMARIVRDLAHKSGKDVRLDISGDTTELDRSMVERIADPLLHMIRNAVDHAIESAPERVAAGKPAHGTVKLSAYHQGGGVVIEVTDDGRGLDRDRILAKAYERGLARADQELSESDVFNLIFLPGFSTAAEVTEISGRGVGMDVVRRNVESMRGRVTITTEPGRGTSFKIVLPLTLAIIDGMVVACGHERYIVPTLSIVESFKPAPDMVQAYAGRGELVRLRGEVLPLVRLSTLFAIDGAVEKVSDGKVVVVETTGRKIGILVDDVISQQQVVIKSFESSVATTRVISGAAILSDGRVGLIIDIDSLCGSGDRVRVTSARDAAAPSLAAAGGA